MKKLLCNIIVILALLVSVCASNVFAQSYLDTKKEEAVKKELAYQTAIKSSVSIFSVSGQGSGKCSGVVLKTDSEQSYILTAKHCISTFEEVYVEQAAVKLIVASPNDDLAYLITKTPVNNKVPIKLAKYTPLVSDAIYLIGYPKFKVYKESSEIIRITKDWIYTNAKAISGCSGGGVFNEKGEFVGILWGGDTYESISIFEPLRDVMRFIKLIRNIK